MAKRKRLQYHHHQLMSSQVTNGTNVAETPATEEKPTETETKTNPVVVDMKNPDSMKQRLGMAKRKRLRYQQ
jgi:hypothetical protein